MARRRSEFDRSAVARWGAGLARDDLARAVTAIGSWSTFRHLGGPELIWQVPSETLRWGPEPFASHSGRYHLDGISAAMAAAQFRATFGANPVHTVLVDDDDLPDEVVELLSSNAAGAGSAFDFEGRARPHEWEIPLRMGVLGEGDAADAIRAEIDHTSYLRAADVDTDVLVCTGSLLDAVRELVRGPRRGASLLVALDGVGSSSTTTSALLSAVELGVAVGGVATLTPDTRGTDRIARLFHRLVSELAHDQSLAVALRRCTDGKVRAWLSPELLRAARPREAARRLWQRVARQVEDQTGGLESFVPPQPTRDVPRPIAAIPAGDLAALADALQVIVERGHFSRESAETTTVAEARAWLEEWEPGLAAGSPRSTADAAPDRSLQAKVRPVAGSDTPMERDAMTSDEVTHELLVRVAEEDATWTSTADRSFTSFLRDQRGPIEVVVAFVEIPSHEGGEHRTITAPLWIPAVGASEEVAFPFAFSADGSFRARVTILLGNRVLQTALFRAAHAGSEIALTAATMVLDPLRSPASGVEFDAAVVFNEVDGQRLAYVHDGLDVRVRNLSGANQVLHDLKRILDEYTVPAYGYDSIALDKLTALMRTLAEQGRLLWEALPDPIPAALLAGPRPPRISVTEAAEDGGELTPIELAYARAAPLEGMPLCPQWQDGLTQGVCPSACPSGRHERDVLCPRAFVGLSAIVERQRGARPPAGSIRLNRGALLATSARVDDKQKSPRPSDLLEARLQTLTGAVSRISDLASWEDAIKNDRQPGAYFLLPHTLLVGTNPAMELGDEAKPVRSVDLQRGWHLAAEARPGPLVVLVGCDTSLAPVAFHSLMARFVVLGAAVVVATVSKVRGPEAAAAVSRLVSALDEGRKQGRSFGQVLLDVRRLLLLRRDPIGLTLVTHGNVDVVTD